MTHHPLDLLAADIQLGSFLVVFPGAVTSRHASVNCSKLPPKVKCNEMMGCLTEVRGHGQHGPGT